MDYGDEDKPAPRVEVMREVYEAEKKLQTLAGLRGWAAEDFAMAARDYAGRALTEDDGELSEAEKEKLEADLAFWNDVIGFMAEWNVMRGEADLVVID